MVNLKSRSCWLILLVDGKTRRNCHPCRDSNKHFMLNYSGLEQKEEEDFLEQAQWSGDPTKRSHRRGPQLNPRHSAHPPRIGKARSDILVQLVKVPGAQPQRCAELFQSFLWEVILELRCPFFPFLGPQLPASQVDPCGHGGGFWRMVRTAQYLSPCEPVSHGRGCGPFQQLAQAKTIPARG